jgi:hypothetical protein
MLEPLFGTYLVASAGDILSSPVLVAIVDFTCCDTATVFRSRNLSADCGSCAGK